MNLTRATETEAAPQSSAIRLLLGESGSLICVIAGVGLLGGLAEAAVLMVIVRSALALTQPPSESGIEMPLIGPLSLTSAVLLGTGILIVRLLLHFAGAWLSAEAYARLRSHWLGDLLERSFSCSWERLAELPEGSFGELASPMVSRAAGAMLNLAVLVQYSASLVILLVATLVINAGAAIAAIVTLAALVFLIRPIGRRIQVQATRTIDEELGLATRIAEVTRSMLEVRAFGVGPQVNARLTADVAAAAHFWRLSSFSCQVPTAVYQAASLGLILGGIGVLGNGSPGQLAGFGTVVLVLIRAFSYGQQMQGQLVAVQASAPAVLQINTALRSFGADLDAGEGLPVPRPFRDLRLSGVRYWYRPDQSILQDLDMEVRSGEVVGLRGRSGMGKTTLLHLLLGLRTPKAGTVNVNGISLDAIDVASWRAAVAFIPQEPMLIEGTVAENIRFFRSNLSDEQVNDAAHRAGLMPDLAAWPEGLDRLVGQRRYGVSGGQRQRITIARALAGNPLILLMDEPTSSLDEEAERVVLETLRALKGKLTVVVAAHRVSTLALCDRIVELERSPHLPCQSAERAPNDLE